VPAKEIEDEDGRKDFGKRRRPVQYKEGRRGQIKKGKGVISEHRRGGGTSATPTGNPGNVKGEEGTINSKGTLITISIKEDRKETDY